MWNENAVIDQKALDALRGSMVRWELSLEAQKRGEERPYIGKYGTCHLCMHYACYACIINDTGENDSIICCNAFYADEEDYLEYVWTMYKYLRRVEVRLERMLKNG